MFDFLAAGIQNTVNAEIQIGAVDLEDFFEFGGEFGELGHGCFLCREK